MSTKPHRVLHWLVLSALVLCSSLAEARIWRDIDGNEIEGDFVRKDGDQVVLLVDGEEKTYPIRIGVAPAAAPKVFVCGPTPMVEAVAEALVALGHEPGRVKTERFGATGGG